MKPISNVKEALESFINSTIPIGASEGQIKDMSMAFIAGAFSSFNLVTETSELNESEAVSRMSAMQKEIMDLATSYMRDGQSVQ